MRGNLFMMPLGQGPVLPLSLVARQSPPEAAMLIHWSECVLGSLKTPQYTVYLEHHLV